MKKIIIIITIFVLVTEVLPQTNSNWFFGQYAGISFSSGNPSLDNESKINQSEGCASISDENGNLLFYTDGITVWNRNHAVMQNGTGLHGHYSSLVSAYIVKQPGHDDIYYLFTIDAASRNLYGVQYSIVDLSQGAGAVVSKNNSLFRFASPKFAATPHANGRDVWIITTRQATDKIIAHLLTDEGIQTPLIETEIGKTYKLDNGFMKFNCPGTKLYMANTADSEILILEFDKLTGKFELLNRIHIDDDVKRRYYSIELSPDNSKLYTTTYNPSGIYRFNINSNDTELIEESFETIAETPSIYLYSGIELGPNGSIYVARFQKKHLGVIVNPNAPFENLTFIDQGFDLGSGISLHGLPTFMRKKCGTPFFLEIKAEPKRLCEGETLTITASGVPGGNYSWSGPNGFSSNAKDLVIEDVTEDMSGVYELTVSYGGYSYTAKDKITIEESPKFSFSGKFSFCKGDSTTIYIEQSSSSTTSFLWENGAKGKSINVGEEGFYTVTATSSNGCVTIDSVEVVEIPPLEVKISGLMALCSGKTTTLESNFGGNNYLYTWRNEEGELLGTDEELEVTKTGYYSLEVREIDGCRGWDTVFVDFYPTPNAEIKGNDEITKCENAAITLEPTNLTENTIYYWFDGVSQAKREVINDGRYILIARNQFGCIAYDTVDVVSIPEPDIEIIPSDTIRICDGESVDLEVFNLPDNSDIRWSTGEKTKKISVKFEGEYEVIVSLFNQCFDTANVYVKVDQNLDVNIIGAKEICEGEPIILKANYQGNRYDYLWSTGETTESIEVTESGVYILEIVSPSGCQGKDTIEVNVYDKPDASLNIFGDIDICAGDNIQVYPTNLEEGFNYYWDDGYAEMTRTIDNDGRYVFYADNDGNCIDSTVLIVNVVDIPQALISAPDGISLCLVDEVTLKIENYDPAFNYEWSTGETSETIVVDQIGWYALEASNGLGCKTTDSIEVIKGGDFDFEISASSLRICNNADITISATDGFSHYEWSTGDTTRTIVINEPGIYSVTITDDVGCTKTDSIQIEEYNIDIEMINPQDNDFGEICFSETVNKELLFRSLSQSNVTIENIIIDNNDFEVVPGYQKSIIAGGDFNLNIRFKPNSIGELESILLISVSEPCEAEFTFPIKGTAYSETLIEAPEISTTVDISNYCIPFTISEICKHPENIIDNYSARIRFDNRFFYPKTVENAVLDDIEFIDGFAEVTLNGNYNGATNIIFNICGHTLIGTKDESDIEIVDFQWENDFIRNSSIDGILSVNGVCKQEFFNMKYFETTEAKATPNPAYDNLGLNIKTEEEGKIKIYLMDLKSNILFEKIINNKGKNVYDINIDTDDLSSGVYYLQVISPYSMTTNRIMIIK